MDDDRVSPREGPAEEPSVLAPPPEAPESPVSPSSSTYSPPSTVELPAAPVAATTTTDAKAEPELPQPLPTAPSAPAAAAAASAATATWTAPSTAAATDLFSTITAPPSSASATATKPRPTRTGGVDIAPADDIIVGHVMSQSYPTAADAAAASSIQPGAFQQPQHASGGRSAAYAVGGGGGGVAPQVVIITGAGGGDNPYGDDAGNAQQQQQQQQQNRPQIGVDDGEWDVLTETTNLSSRLRILWVFEFVITIINGISFPLMFIALPFTIVGYVSARFFKPTLAYIACIFTLLMIPLTIVDMTHIGDDFAGFAKFLLIVLSLIALFFHGYVGYLSVRLATAIKELNEEQLRDVMQMPPVCGFL